MVASATRAADDRGDRASGEVDTADAEQRPASRGLWYASPGAWVALVFACLAFTPSLLPRGAVFQGVVCGASAAVGYGIGVLGAWVWRAFADREQRPEQLWARHLLAVCVVVASVVAVALGQRWQVQIRDLMDAPAPNWVLLPVLPVVATALFVGLIALSRTLRTAYRAMVTLLVRWMGARAARPLGWIIVVGGTWLVVSGVLVAGLSAVADRTFASRDTTTREGVTQPTSSLRSGGPDSMIAWETLGRQGRSFVGLGPTTDELSEISGTPAMEPIRAYAGFSSADEIGRRAQLAVADLERAGGFDRAHLMIAGTTGSGWVDPGSIDTFEYITAGDSAAVAMQYSHLPSWISYLVDQDVARAAGRELFDAVYERWSQLPVDDRPKLYAFGESLGSFGAETAFSGEFDLRNRTAGALFAGPPNFNTLHREFTDRRAPGSPEIEPIYRDGRTVRFTTDVARQIPPASAPWDGARVLYLQHPSDPIVWWNTDLALQRPDWLREPHGRDVLDDMTWIPFVTFWQVSADLALSTDVPPGHGHTYTREYVDGWATVLQPEGWSSDAADRLRTIITRPDS